MSATEESVRFVGTIERFQIRAREVKETALRAVGTALKSVMPERGPSDYDAFADERRFYQKLLREQGGRVNNGDGESNWKTIALFVMGFLQALILAFMGYIYSTTSETHDDVIRIKCRLDPQSCMGAPNGRP